jgi:hypothetical protein
MKVRTEESEASSRKAGDFKHLPISFDSQAIADPAIALCERCGTEMEHREFEFRWFGTEKVWTIPVPVCPVCSETGSLKSFEPY